eukprot:6025857-Amphidinium_carterae.2
MIESTVPQEQCATVVSLATLPSGTHSAHGKHDLGAGNLLQCAWPPEDKQATHGEPPYHTPDDKIKPLESLETYSPNKDYY